MRRAWPGVVIASVSAATLAFVLVLWVSHAHSVQWGDGATWVTFVVILLGAPVAFYQLELQRRQLKDQQDAFAEEAERNRRRDQLLDVDIPWEIDPDHRLIKLPDRDEW